MLCARQRRFRVCGVLSRGGGARGRFCDVLSGARGDRYSGGCVRLVACGVAWFSLAVYCRVLIVWSRVVVPTFVSYATMVIVRLVITRLGAFNVSR